MLKLNEYHNLMDAVRIIRQAITTHDDEIGCLTTTPAWKILISAESYLRHQAGKTLRGGTQTC